MNAQVLPLDHPVADAAVRAIRSGDTAALARLLEDNPALAGARIGSTKLPEGVVAPDTAAGAKLLPVDPTGESRSLLHVATDWPGHFPDVARTIALLVDAGADVNARFTGAHAETPLHWAASSDDVAALDALLDAGADIDAPGGVIAGGPPLADAVAFAQWNAARRLAERGATVGFGHAAALGLLSDLERRMANADDRPGHDEIDDTLWLACHGGQRDTAELLLAHGATLNRCPRWEKLTPLDAARRNSRAESSSRP